MHIYIYTSLFWNPDDIADIKPFTVKEVILPVSSAPWEFFNIIDIDDKKNGKDNNDNNSSKINDNDMSDKNNDDNNYDNNIQDNQTIHCKRSDSTGFICPLYTCMCIYT
jgi:hypothetical protein